MGDNQKIFVSRAGADSFVAAEVAAIMEKAGYETILQQWDFANRNFVERMHAALESGGRIVSLLSPEYLRSDQCTAEWTNAIADDPLNKKSRLVVLRVADCTPVGLLSAIAYWDLVPILESPALLRDVVLSALRYDHHNTGEPSGFRRAPRTMLDAEAIRESPSFLGRHSEFDAIERAMRTSSRVAISGLAGVGKSSLARAYAWRKQDDYSIVWWLNSETTEGLIDGFIRLGSLFVRDLGSAKDREQAARRVVAGMLNDLDKPALLIFDNLEDESLLGVWCPRQNVRALITSRSSGWNSDVVAIPLVAWSTGDSIAYLKRESGRRDFTDDDAGRLSAELGGLPLALSHAAAYLRRTRTVSIDNYLARLTEHMARAPKGVDYPQAVFGTFRAAVLRAEEESSGAVALLCLSSILRSGWYPREALQRRDRSDDASLASAPG